MDSEYGGVLSTEYGVDAVDSRLWETGSGVE